MTITILKPGASKYRAECPGCTCQFTYDLGDTDFWRGTERKDVRCPSCGTSVPHYGCQAAVETGRRARSYR